MRRSYQYRLKPTKKQAEIIDNTLDMLRCQYNYQLAQRFDPTFRTLTVTHQQKVEQVVHKN